MTTKLTNHIHWTRHSNIILTDNYSSLDSEDDSYTGCQNQSEGIAAPAIPEEGR